MKSLKEQVTQKFNWIEKLPTNWFTLAIDIVASSTRRDDLLVDKETQQRVWILRKHLSDMNPVEAMDFLKDRLKNTQTNEEFLIAMNG